MEVMVVQEPVGGELHKQKSVVDLSMMMYKDNVVSCLCVCRQHLGRLRAFSVTATHWVRDSPPPPHSPPVPNPPFPPFAPFSECQDTCTPGTIPDHRKYQCRDGGYGAYFPTLCWYSTEVH